MNNASNIIGITVCVNYSDLLKIALKQNTNFLKYIYVITKKEDLKTIESCKDYDNVEVLFDDFLIDMSWYDTWQFRYDSKQAGQRPPPKRESDVARINLKAFNKGKALRRGQKAAELKFPNDFYLIMDCDIVLNKYLIGKINQTELEMDLLYGVRERRDYPTFQDFSQQKNYKTYGGSAGGWGFFQLYKNSTPIYYDNWHTAAATDKWFKEDVIKRDHANLKIFESHVDHLGQEGASQFLKDFKFDL
jgi:hypothetical protein